MRVFAGQGGVFLAFSIHNLQLFGMSEGFAAVGGEQDFAILSEHAAGLIFGVVWYRVVDDDVIDRFLMRFTKVVV